MRAEISKKKKRYTKYSKSWWCSDGQINGWKGKKKKTHTHRNAVTYPILKPKCLIITKCEKEPKVTEKMWEESAKTTMQNADYKKKKKGTIFWWEAKEK